MFMSSYIYDQRTGIPLTLITLNELGKFLYILISNCLEAVSRGFKAVKKRLVPFFKCFRGTIALYELIGVLIYGINMKSARELFI